MTTLVGMLRTALGASLVQITVILSMIVLPSLFMARLERLSRGMLTSAFGWRAILVTGWLGVPVHELSHLVACSIFGHRVSGVSLFSPDSRTGTLGYVNHSWDEASRWQRAGNFFIGIAPVAGGVCVMLVIMAFAIPDKAILASGTNVVASLLFSPGFEQGMGLVRHFSWDLPGAIFSADMLLSVRTWLSVYALMCIGLHMSPSSEDLHGHWHALGWMLGIVTFVNLLFAPLGGIPTGCLRAASLVLAPVASAMLLAVVTSLGSLAIIAGVSWLGRLVKAIWSR